MCKKSQPRDFDNTFMKRNMFEEIHPMIAERAHVRNRPWLMSVQGHENRVRRHNSVPLTPRDMSVASTRMTIQGVLTGMGWRAAP